MSKISSTSADVKDPTNKRGRVLMIHGWAQNSGVMKMKTKSLTRKLSQAGYECVFLDAPFVLPKINRATSESLDSEVTHGGRDNARAWFLYSDSDPTDTSLAQSEKAMNYIGIDRSLKSIENALESEGSKEAFSAVLGFSQGGVLVHLLSALAAKSKKSNETPFSKIRCAVIASGFSAEHDNTGHTESTFEFDNLSGVIDLPSLHLIGRNDTSVSPGLSKKLVEKYHGAEVHFHEKGHSIPQKSSDCATIVAFLDNHNRKQEQ